MRSVSVVDTAVAQRAKARAPYAFLAHKKASNTCTSAINNAAIGSLPRPRTCAGQQQAQQSTAHSLANSGISPRACGRSGVSQSQPSSRSTSSSKLREQQVIGSYYRPTGTIPKKDSAIPRSLASSRETSPTRSGAGGGVIVKRSMYTAGNPRRTPERNQPTRQLAAARLLQQSRDAENILADVLSPEGRSSVRPTFEDIDTIIQYCASKHWSERKDGLISLIHYLAGSKELKPHQLQLVLDTFRTRQPPRFGVD